MSKVNVGVILKLPHQLPNSTSSYWRIQPTVPGHKNRHNRLLLHLTLSPDIVNCSSFMTPTKYISAAALYKPEQLFTYCVCGRVGARGWMEAQDDFFSPATELIFEG
ncbi:hypothetical protein CDAR_433011 [Caerostris darwini]|uniref:Uncharacterized protein n=1 Tax=Caerostris darwini TaxID=1538125 RepID=A0AAV4QK00_9ARAC|nr:hypothetical protein CDAR_433011 [Caerostris darwini]